MAASSRDAIKKVVETAGTARTDRSAVAAKASEQESIELTSPVRNKCMQGDWALGVDWW